MAQFYEMPAISPTMELGTLVEWKVKEGQAVKPQDVVAEVGTDKANMEAEVFDAGVMIKHLVEEGAEVPPGFPIAIVGQSADEDISALLAEFEERRKSLGSAPAASSGEAARSEAAPAERPPSEAAPAERPPSEAAPAGRPPSEAVSARRASGDRTPTPSRPAPTRATAREWMGKSLSTLFADPPGDVGLGAVDDGPAASPLARRVAEDLGVALRRVKGTGPGGRVQKADVMVAAERVPAMSADARPAREDEIVRASPMRKTIARRLLQSHQDIPTFFLTASLDGQGFVDLRATLGSKLPDTKISYNDMLIVAVARALRDHPEVNASWGGDHLVRHGRVDVGMAVAVDQGLITPVIRDADRLGLAAVADATRALARKAREGALQPDEYQGATFTISNLGMMDIEHFTAIINPPEAAILAVGALRQEPVAIDGALGLGWRMRVTMTCDHRVVDGAVGAAFLQTLRRYVETPALLLV